MNYYADLCGPSEFLKFNKFEISVKKCSQKLLLPGKICYHYLCLHGNLDCHTIRLKSSNQIFAWQ